MPRFVAKVSRLLVIDASIARAAGGEGARYPLSKQCRDLLKNVLEVCHRAASTASIQEEWKKHRSVFSRKWQSSMMARKKWILIDECEDALLRAGLAKAARSDRGREAMLKDAHLLEAAQVTDQIVISIDDTVRGLFAAASKHVAVMRKIVWVSPADSEDALKGWLEEGAQMKKGVTLHNQRTR